MKLLLSLVLVTVLVSSVLCDHWALLVAGSNGFENYRHQADICHAYHIVRNHGIPEENIIVMMYDDIAYNLENPYIGNVINRPNGPNVYKGVWKDYTGKEVTPEVFLKVLSGDEKGIEKLLGRKGRVIKSGPNDNVFVNFADHGAPGLIAFPSDELHADDLNKVIVQMHQNEQYKHMVFYVEACESGSMFDGILKKDINVFATTAADPDQSSYACYYDKERETYLGDVYSVMWMQDSETENLAKESLQKQFKIVKKETNTSHVMEYGDMSLKWKKVAYFQGNLNETESDSIDMEDDAEDNTLFFNSEVPKKPKTVITDAVPSEDVPLEILKRKALAANGEDKLKHEAAVRSLLRKKVSARSFFKSIVQSVINSNYEEIVQKKLKFTDFTCYKEGIRMIKSMCPGLNLIQNNYALRNLRALANLCETEVPKEMIWAAIKRVTSKNAIC